MKVGQVLLVGAGPGDPELLTLKAHKAITTAEVVVYDQLVSRPILDLIPAAAERIDVGKRAGHHTMPQAQINQLLLQKALEGKQVVRLKGGDPFLFGRGAEELDLLQRHQVPFQEIPGITSAIAVPAYAGIPVTWREYSSSVHIITGHRQAGKELDIDFDALVRAGGTLVFLMGVSTLPHICAGLLQAGMAPDTPAAVVEKGTTPAQRTITATLAALPQAARQQAVQSPAVIVIGPVCACAEEFGWFGRLPLKGQPVVVTRPKERAGSLCAQLRALGADVIEFACNEALPLQPCPEMEQAIGDIHRYKWLVFTSPAGVQALMQMLQRTGRDVRALGGIKLAVIGPGTGRALQQYGLRADLMPGVYDSAHLGQALCAAQPAGRVLILRAQWGTRELTDVLAAHGVEYSDIRCYETRYTAPNTAQVRRQLGRGCIATFTSASTVEGFVRALGADADLSHVLAACIGRQTEAAARRHGLRTCTAPQATIDALVQTIVEAKQTMAGSAETCLPGTNTQQKD